MVDHLLHTLKSYRKPISDPKSFYKVMGLQYNNEDINNNLIQIGLEDYVEFS